MFNNPYSYNPYYPNVQMPDPIPPARQAPAQNGAINWVSGIEGAKAFLVAPNNSVLLMDSEGSSFYMKSADASGMPTLRVFDYTERTQPKSPVNGPTSDSALADRVTALERKIEALTAKGGESNG